jgi:hypothetical protein
MTYRRTIFGRLLGYGDLILESAGQHQALTEVTYIPDPNVFYRTITTLLAARGDFPPALPPDAVGHPDDDDTGPIPRVIV